MAITDVNHVRRILKHIIADVHARIAKADDAHVQSYMICDEATDNYLILLVGWDVTGRVLGPCLHFRIYQDKVWVEENTTDFDSVEECLTAHLSKDDIVLGFLDPQERAYSDFAVA